MRRRRTSRKPIVKLLFPSADQVVELHAALLERWGGEEGGGHRGAEYEGAEAAVQAVKNSYYETAQELAAAFAVYIIQGHAFMDGNKRAGSATLFLFLHANGVQTAFGGQEARDAMIELQKRAEDGERTDRLVSWLAAKL